MQVDVYKQMLNRGFARYVGGLLFDKDDNVIDIAAASGFKYTFSTTTTAGDPGAGFIRFNNAAIGSVTKIYIDTITNNAIDLSLYFATFEAGGKLIIMSVDGSFAIFTIAAVTNSSGYYTLDVVYVAGTAFADAEACSIVYNDSAETPTYDHLADANLPPAATNPNLVVVLKKILSTHPYGGKSIAISNGTVYAGVGRVILEHFNETVAVVCPNTGLTWVASNNNGFVQLQSQVGGSPSAHGLTAGVCDDFASLHIKTASTGWSLDSLHKIDAVLDTTNILLQTPWDAAMVAPVISTINEQFRIHQVPIPGMLDNSRIIIDANWHLTGSANAKTPEIKFGGNSIFLPAAITGAGNATLFTPIEIYNKNSKTIQASRHSPTNTSGSGNGGAPNVYTNLDTTNGTTLTFHGTSAAVNEPFGLRSRLIEMVY